VTQKIAVRMAAVAELKMLFICGFRSSHTT